MALGGLRGSTGRQLTRHAGGRIAPESAAKRDELSGHAGAGDRRRPPLTKNPAKKIFRSETPRRRRKTNPRAAFLPLRLRVSAREILQLRSSPSNVPTNVVGPAQSRWYPPRRDREQEEPLSKDLGGSRILVTGAGGFIGSHLTEALLHEGASVRALVHYDSRGDWARLDSSDRRAAAAPRGARRRRPRPLPDRVDGRGRRHRRAPRGAGSDPLLVPGTGRFIERMSAERCTCSRRRAATASGASSRLRAARSMAARATPRSTRRIPCRRSRPTRRARSAPTRSPNRTTGASECR